MLLLTQLFSKHNLFRRRKKTSPGRRLTCTVAIVDGAKIVESLTAPPGLDVADKAVVCPFLEGASINSELSCCNGGFDIH